MSVLDGCACSKTGKARARSTGPRHGIGLRFLAAALGQLARYLCWIGRHRCGHWRWLWARQRAAISGALTRALGRGGSVWGCFNPGASTRSGLAARLRTVTRLGPAHGREDDRAGYRRWHAASRVVAGRTVGHIPEAGADARRAPAGRGPGWPESMRLGSGAGPGTHRERLVGRPRRGARLLCRPPMRRQDAGADARRAPAGRGPGWPESISTAWRQAVGFSG